MQNKKNVFSLFCIGAAMSKSNQPDAQSRLPRPNQSAALEYITPELAAVYLMRNRKHGEGQRTLVRTLVERIKSDLINGDFITTHQGIAFDDDGALFDGQNRLTAIVQTGVAVWMWVFRGLDKKAAYATDCGVNRRIQHAMQVLGVENASNDTVAIARAMRWLPKSPNSGSGQMSQKQVIDFAISHTDAIHWAQQQIPRSKGASVLRALFARAWYHADRDKLKKAASVISDREDQQEPSRLDMMLVRFFVSSNQACNGSAERISWYKRGQNVLLNFLNDTLLQKFYERDDDIFPLVELKEVD